MKYILYIAPRTILHPLTGEPAGKLAQDKFLLEIACGQEFGSGKSMIEKIEFALAVRAAIQGQAGGASLIGHYAFEDAHAAELKKRAAEFSCVPVVYEAALPILKGIRDQLDELPASAARPLPTEANGAAAQA